MEWYFNDWVQSVDLTRQPHPTTILQQKCHPLTAEQWADLRGFKREKQCRVSLTYTTCWLEWWHGFLLKCVRSTLYRNIETMEVQVHYSEGICHFPVFAYTFTLCVSPGWYSCIIKQCTPCVKCQGLIWICSGMWHGTEVLNPVKIEAERGMWGCACAAQGKKHRQQKSSSQTSFVFFFFFFFLLCELKKKMSLLQVCSHTPTCLCLYSSLTARWFRTPYFLSTVLACEMTAHWVKLSNWMHHLIVCCLYSNRGPHQLSTIHVR